MPGDRLGTVRAAVVQASSCFLDREATIDKARDLILRAAADGAEVIVFPEGFIPAHPIWFHFQGATSASALEMSAELFRNSVTVAGPELKRLAETARSASVWVVMGACEKRPLTTGTMWNSAIHLSPDGKVASVHRKLTPTVGERLVHTGGNAAGLRVPKANCGPISSLICAENTNPLLVFSVAAQYAVIHASLWPNIFSPTLPRMRDVIATSSRALAYQAGCYVLNAAGTLTEAIARRIAVSEADLQWLSDPDNSGGSCIVAPNGSMLAGPAGAEETILTADLDLDALVAERVIHDYAGHYNRADILELVIRPNPGPIFEAPWLSAQLQDDEVLHAAGISDHPDQWKESERPLARFSVRRALQPASADRRVNPASSAAGQP